VNTLTHAIIGLAISEALLLSPLLVVIGAVIPDLDYIIGIPHRGITHSLIFVILPVLAMLKLKGKRAALALFLGISSHLILDSVNPMGVPLLYPFEEYYSFNLIAWDSVVGNLGLIILAAIIILNKKNIQEYLVSLKKGQLLKGTLGFVTVWMGMLLLFPVGTCPSNTTNINYLHRLVGDMSVTVNGTICSDINLTTSKAGNKYQVFTLCDETGNITIWKGEWVLENNLSKGDIIKLCGKFTRKFKEPEIYYVNSVSK